MKILKKKITALLLAAAMSATGASASILGTATELVGTRISHGSVLYENKFMSEQSGVGLQSEYYCEYVPNTDTVPYVATGESIYGKRTASQAAEYMEKNGMRPMLGINASFFSFATGVPMGHVISDGRVMSKDISTLRSVGFLPDSTAFIAPLGIDVTIKTEGGEAGAANVNKFNVATQPGISIFTEDFGEQTRNNVESLSVVLKITDGTLKIGTTMTGVVTDKFVYSSGLAIDEGHMILSINTDASYDYHYNILNALAVGDEVSLTTSATGDERWQNAVSALGSEGEVLIENGGINQNLSGSAAPRTAVGITKTGSVIFYVIDGRQKGHSYGVKLKTLAERLSELGCVEALNMDGGGSTTMFGVHPGADSAALVNSPSDGAQRKVTNFIFLKNNNKPSGVLSSIYVTPQQGKYLSGTSVTLSAIGLDSEFYKTDAGEVSYSAPEPCEVSANTVKLVGNGTVGVTAKSGEVETVSDFYVCDEPDEIVFYANGNRKSALVMHAGDTAALTAECYLGYSKLQADQNAVSFSVSGDVGTIADGVFTADSDITRDGTITVTAGKKTLQIPVHVTNDDYVFADVSEHWAREMIRDMARKNVINGYETGDGLVFRPDEGITRAEAAVMLAGYFGIEDTSEGTKFSDSIPGWARPSINALAAVGFISGRPTADGVIFAPNDKITRCELAAILGRALPYEAQEGLAFSDGGEIPDWAAPYVSALSAQGIVSGYADGAFRPTANVTRAEAVVMLYKASAIK